MNSSDNALDLRIRRTDKFLWDALTSLMVEHDFESITVTDICERAMVHRTTFYKHYEDKYALLNQGIQNQLTLLFDELNMPAGKPVKFAGELNVAPHLRLVFEHVLKNERFYRLMLCGEGIGKFYTLFRKMLVDDFLRRSEAHARRKEKQILMRSSLRAHSHAGVLISTIAWWLENDYPYTSAEMAQYLWEDTFS